MQNASRTLATQVAGGAFVVQVSAQKTEDEARASYQVLQQKYPCVLSGRDPIVRRAELGQSGTLVSRPRRLLRDLRTGNRVLQ